MKIDKTVLSTCVEKKLFFTPRRLLVVALAFSLIACLPTVQRIYHAPVVIGQVIDLNSLDPIEGASIQHENPKANLPLDGLIEKTKNNILSDKQGQYHLPSLSSVEAVVLMPGYAITNYPVRISTKDNSALVFASASLFMRDEEITTAPLLILDPAPEVIADTPPGDYLNYKILRTYLYPHSRLGMCDIGIGGDALTTLNTARKLYWRHKNEQPITLEMLDAAYLNVQNIWSYFYNSCDFGKNNSTTRRDNIFSVREITDNIKSEANRFTSQ